MKKPANDDEHGWSLYLQQDSSKEGISTSGKQANGFVVAQLKGGKLIRVASRKE